MVKQSPACMYKPTFSFQSINRGYIPSDELVSHSYQMLSFAPASTGRGSTGGHPALSSRSQRGGNIIQALASTRICMRYKSQWIWYKWSREGGDHQPWFGLCWCLARDEPSRALRLGSSHGHLCLVTACLDGMNAQVNPPYSRAPSSSHLPLLGSDDQDRRCRAKDAA